MTAPDMSTPDAQRDAHVNLQIAQADLSSTLRGISTVRGSIGQLMELRNPTSEQEAQLVNLQAQLASLMAGKAHQEALIARYTAILAG